MYSNNRSNSGDILIGFDEEESLLNALLMPYGSDELNHKINGERLLRTIYYIKSTKHFEKLLIHLLPFLNL